MVIVHASMDGRECASAICCLPASGVFITESGLAASIGDGSSERLLLRLARRLPPCAHALSAMDMRPVHAAVRSHARLASEALPPLPPRGQVVAAGIVEFLSPHPLPFYLESSHKRIRLACWFCLVQPANAFPSWLGQGRLGATLSGAGSVKV